MTEPVRAVAVEMEIRDDERISVAAGYRKIAYSLEQNAGDKHQAAVALGGKKIGG